MKNQLYGKLVTFFLVLLISLNLSADSKPNVKFGKVDISAIKQKVHPLDSAASAAYLYKSAKAYFDVTERDIFLVIEHHQRIKVYDEDGESYANFQIPLYRDGTTRERVSKIKAMTYNMENGKVKTTKLSKKDMYKEKVSDNWETEKFALPDVKAGSVIEVKYTFTTPFKYAIPAFYFQEYVPVDEASYEVRIPDYYTYTPVPTGTIALSTSKREVNGDYRNDMAYTFSTKEVPAMVKDEYVLNTDDYRSSLKYELYSSHFPNSSIQYYSKDWNEISKDLMSNRYFGKQLGKRTKELEPFLATLSGKSNKEKILAIYEHVRTSYRWNGNYGKYRSHSGVKEFIKEKSGNVADVNQLLINLLIQADIETYPFLVKSRGNGLLNQNFPSKTELNYLLAYVQLEDGYMLLDGTSKYTPLGNLPVRATNINGLLLKGSKGQIVSLSSPNLYKSVMMATYDINLDNPSLEGTGKAMYKNYAATMYRASAAKEDLEEEEENEEDMADVEEEEEDEVLLENEFNVIEVKNLDNIYKDVSLEFSEKIYNEITAIGDQIFLDATLDFGMDENPFYQESRDYPVFFRYKVDKRHIVKVNLPEDYDIESLPETVAMTLPEGKANFKYSAKIVGETLVLDYNLKVNTDYYAPTEYEGLRELYRLVIEKTKEKVVLTKKT